MLIEVDAGFVVFLGRCHRGWLHLTTRFPSRAAVAAHVTLASAVSALPLLYHNPPGTAARTVVGVLLLVVIGGIVTLLREGLQRQQRELEALAMSDPLTGVGNYRLHAERLDYEIARHRRSGGSLAVLLLDLDGFKEVNDTFGHLVGDRVLVEVARALSASSRSQDTLARQGGDEFSILAPETDAEEATRLAARAQKALYAATSGSVTTSVGCATFPHDAEDSATLIALADADLRRTKGERGVDGRRRETELRARVLRPVERTAINHGGG